MIQASNTLTSLSSLDLEAKPIKNNHNASPLPRSVNVDGILIFLFFSEGKGLILFMPMIYRGDAGAVAAAVCGEVIQAMPNSKPDPQRLALLEEYTWNFNYDSNLQGIFPHLQTTSQI